MASMPTGTVTFLFTDIQGSTALWERQPKRMKDALALHDATLREAVESRGGSVFKTMGDAFCAVFAVAPAALEAALSVQRSLKELDETELGPLLVRMAIHSGTSDERGGDYFGPSVNRVARLLAAAHGGQILLSQATYNLVRDTLPAGIGVLDLGEHRLRDITRPERIYQLISADLTADFPALRTMGPVLLSSASETVSERATSAGARPSSPPGAALEVFMLGGFRVARRGDVLADEVWRRRKARQLFKLLLTRRGRRLAKDEACELLWPESDPEAAAVNLRTTVYAIRRALAPPGVGETSELLVIDRDSVALLPQARVWTDADALEQALAQAREATDPLPLLREADALYAGDYLPDDLYEDWATERRESLKRSWSELQFWLAQLGEQQGDIEAAISALQRLLTVEPCDERAAAELMGLLGRRGRRAEALRVYQNLAQSLRNELQVEPSEALVELHRKLAAGEVAAAAPGPHPGREAQAFVCSYPFPSPGQIFGRESEQVRLDRVYGRVRSGGQVVLLDAPAGTGKSTLLGALVRRARAAGVLCLAGGCYEEKGLVPLGPFQEALADYFLSQPPEQLRADLGTTAPDLARLVPELGYQLNIPDAPWAEPEAERIRLFGAVHAYLRSLAVAGPVMLCLEDVHAADAATLQLIHYLARQSRRLPLTLVCTYRTEEASSGQPLGRLQIALIRERLAEYLALGPLDREAVASLTASVLDGPASQDLTDVLYAASQGNPLFLEQLVLALREEGQVELREGVWQAVPAPTSRGVPRLVREVVGQRLSHLSGRCRDTLEAAAILGQSVQYATLAAMSPTAEADLLVDLEEAFDAHLLQEAASGYAFGHPLLREAVYWSVSPPKRMRLHARAAEAIEGVFGGRASDQSAELARHFGLAGQSPEVRAKALSYSLEAGRRAAALSAYNEALVHFEKANELIEQVGGQVGKETRLDALEGRGYAERSLAMWDVSVESFRQLLELSAEPLRRARARVTIGFALHHTGDTAGALAESDAGLAELERAGEGSEVEEARLRLLGQKAYLGFLAGHFLQVLDLGQAMLNSAQRLQQPRSLFQAHSALGWAYMGQGQIEPAIEQYQQAHAAAERSDDKVHLAVACENLGIQLLRSGDHAESRRCLERAVSLYRDSAGELRSVNAMQALGRLSLAEGDPREARKQAEGALALALEGHDRWEAECHDLLGSIHALGAHWNEAEASFGEALRIRRRVGHAAGIVDSLIALGSVCEQQSDRPRARELYEQAAQAAAAMDPCPQAVSVQRHLGSLLLHLGDLSAAGQQIRRAIKLAETMPGSQEQAAALLAMAELALESGKPASARQHVDRALVAARTAELTAQAHLVFARLCVPAGQAAEARSHVLAVKENAGRLGSPLLDASAEKLLAELDAPGGAQSSEPAPS